MHFITAELWTAAGYLNMKYKQDHFGMELFFPLVQYKIM